MESDKEKAEEELSELLVNWRTNVASMVKYLDVVNEQSAGSASTTTTTTTAKATATATAAEVPSTPSLHASSDTQRSGAAQRELGQDQSFFMSPMSEALGEGVAESPRALRELQLTNHLLQERISQQEEMLRQYRENMQALLSAQQQVMMQAAATGSPKQTTQEASQTTESTSTAATETPASGIETERAMDKEGKMDTNQAEGPVREQSAFRGQQQPLRLFRPFPMARGRDEAQAARLVDGTGTGISAPQLMARASGSVGAGGGVYGHGGVEVPRAAAHQAHIRRPMSPAIRMEQVARERRKQATQETHMPQGKLQTGTQVAVPQNMSIMSGSSQLLPRTVLFAAAASTSSSSSSSVPTTNQPLGHPPDHTQPNMDTPRLRALPQQSNRPAKPATPSQPSASSQSAVTATSAVATRTALTPMPMPKVGAKKGLETGEGLPRGAATPSLFDIANDDTFVLDSEEEEEDVALARVQNDEGEDDEEERTLAMEYGRVPSIASSTPMRLHELAEQDTRERGSKRGSRKERREKRRQEEDEEEEDEEEEDNHQASFHAPWLSPEREQERRRGSSRSHMRRQQPRVAGMERRQGTKSMRANYYAPSLARTAPGARADNFKFRSNANNWRHITPDVLDWIVGLRGTRTDVEVEVGPEVGRMEGRSEWRR